MDVARDLVDPERLLETSAEDMELEPTPTMTTTITLTSSTGPATHPTAATNEMELPSLG